MATAERAETAPRLLGRPRFCCSSTCSLVSFVIQRQDGGAWAGRASPPLRALSAVPRAHEEPLPLRPPWPAAGAGRGRGRRRPTPRFLAGKKSAHFASRAFPSLPFPLLALAPLPCPLCPVPFAPSPLPVSLCPCPFALGPPCAAACSSLSVPETPLASFLLPALLHPALSRALSCIASVYVRHANSPGAAALLAVSFGPAPFLLSLSLPLSLPVPCSLRPLRPPPPRFSSSALSPFPMAAAGGLGGGVPLLTEEQRGLVQALVARRICTATEIYRLNKVINGNPRWTVQQEATGQANC